VGRRPLRYVLVICLSRIVEQASDCNYRLVDDSNKNGSRDVEGARDAQQGKSTGGVERSHMCGKNRQVLAFEREEASYFRGVLKRLIPRPDSTLYDPTTSYTRECWRDVFLTKQSRLLTRLLLTILWSAFQSIFQQRTGARMPLYGRQQEYESLGVILRPGFTGETPEVLKFPAWIDNLRSHKPRVGEQRREHPLASGELRLCR
jgi:hypothetical protein